MKYLFYYSDFLLIYSILVLVSCNSLDKSGKKEHSSLVKRNENDLQSCLDNFDIHTDKIIRTQDSKAMGAKFLNERDVVSRDDCLRLCCETENCDVFVYEEKNPGSCYLFECGSPEDFKCKFTKHKNYTSAVLAANRHLTELETQIKFTQHEHELTRLRDPIQEEKQAPVLIKTTSEAPLNKESIHLVPVPPNLKSESKSKSSTTKCSMYQFTCHSSGECIAIYNACDGIPQCSDGSDEAPELGCPGQTTTTSKPNPETGQVSSVKQDKVDSSGNVNYNMNVQQQYPTNGDPTLRQHQWRQQQYMRKNSETENIPNGNHFPGNSQAQGINPQNLRPNYGREGEGMSYTGEQPWQYRTNNGGSQIFTHKGNGLVQQSDRYQHAFSPMDPVTGNGGPYNDHVQSDAMKYNNYNNYQDNVSYRRYPQGPQVNGNWDVHKTIEVPQGNPGEEIPVSNVERFRNGNMNPPDYFYEDFYRRAPQVPARFQSQTSNFQAPVQSNSEMHQEALKHADVQREPMKDREGGTEKHPSTSAPETVTSFKTTAVTMMPKAEHIGHEHSAHRKLEKLTAEITLRESSFSDSETEGHNSSPSGAILSLTFGLCITCIMVVLVGCRMRMVHRRMRRGGKSPYAHDADFLVNGMYL